MPDGPGGIDAFLGLPRDASTAASFPAAPEDYAERAVALRLTRQHLLSRPEPPGYWIVLDETVIRRPIGGRKIMRAQLEHLAQIAERPSVTIQVIPFAAGWHPACTGCSQARELDERIEEFSQEAITAELHSLSGLSGGTA